MLLNVTYYRIKLNQRTGCFSTSASSSFRIPRLTIAFTFTFNFINFYKFNKIKCDSSCYCLLPYKQCPTLTRRVRRWIISRYYVSGALWRCGVATTFIIRPTTTALTYFLFIFIYSQNNVSKWHKGCEENLNHKRKSQDYNLITASLFYFFYYIL